MQYSALEMTDPYSEEVHYSQNEDVERREESSEAPVDMRSWSELRTCSDVFSLARLGLFNQPNRQGCAVCVEGCDRPAFPFKEQALRSRSNHEESNSDLS